MKKSFDELNLEFIEYARNLRKEKGITQKEVAEILGVSRSMYARVESGLSSYFPYLDKMTAIIGPELISFFPYDINYYTNHRLLICMLLFGWTFEAVGIELQLQDKQVKKLVFNPKKKYIVQYKDDIERMFPEYKSIGLDTKIRFVGKNSVILDTKKKAYVFFNIMGKKISDTIFDLQN